MLAACLTSPAGSGPDRSPSAPRLPPPTSVKPRILDGLPPIRGPRARLVHEEHGLPGWWAQTVTVGYERIRGLREWGQRRDGTFEVSKSKVYPVPIEELWKGFCRCKLWLGGATQHMRWSDGTPVDAGFYAKGPGKSQVAIAHRKIASRAEADRLRAFWTSGSWRSGACLPASAEGKPSTDVFPLADWNPDARRATFANPEHDFPKTLTYHRAADDRLVITLAGDEGGKPRTETYDLRRKD